MPYFTAKKRCFYNGQMYEKGAVAEFFEPVSAASWEPMDEEGHDLLLRPEGSEQKAETATVSGDEFAELKGVHEGLLADFNRQQERITAIEQERDNAINSVLELQQENETLAKSAEAATAVQAKVTNLKKLVADNENKSVLEEAIQNM